MDAVRNTATHFPVLRSRGEAVTHSADGAARHTRPLRLDGGGWVLAFALIMFGGIFALRLSVSASDAAGLFLLFVVPIAAVTLVYGSPAGAAAATVALALVYLRADPQSVGMEALGYATRAVTFFAIPLVIWLAQRDAERSRAAAVATEASPNGTPKPRRSASPARKDLTRRELEVLRLLAAGRTNTEIAEQLVLSVRTIESHRASLRRKLGRPSPSELRRHALQRGLLSGDIAA
jgi:DNA-binding CsgD family transcriptional regulator